ncbi:MAG: 3-hydroxyacyl-CoA dehydrogenase NAD-binding domain-containing protein [Proteobacteria bacterium]|nr:3-hydroxyacyl-CoA dehydrogenase NAD-binding domain-containing protein [Pseudomonadota bacterium]
MTTTKTTGQWPGDDLFRVLESRHTPRCTLWSDPPSGLRAVLVVDDWTLGRAAGGTRTRAYPSLAAAVDDAAHLARAMTLKCSLGGVDAGGAKVVVLDHPGLDRAAAFARLGQLIGELGGRFVTSGDLGTNVRDLEIMAEHCDHIHIGESDLSEATARGLLRCIEAVAERAGKAGLAGLRVAVQGCGAIGSAVAKKLAQSGVEVLVADIDRDRAEALAADISARHVAADDILVADVDIVSPCAIGGVVTAGVVDRLRAWAVCGAANNIVADAGAEQRMQTRGILHVPDIIASAGAVVEGAGDVIMGLADRGHLIDRLGDTAGEILDESQRTGRPTGQLAQERAWARIRDRSGRVSPRK